MFNFLLGIVYSLSGWKTVNIPSADLKKCIFTVCPHNSWVDVPIGLGARGSLGFKIHFLGKEELFKGMFGWFFYALGGTPLVRHQSMNQVDLVVKTFEEHDTLRIAMSPEGTRKNVSKLRTGFYYIAHAAKVPIVRVAFDYQHKEIRFAEPFMPTGNFQADMQQYFVPYFKGIIGENEWVKNYENGKF